MKKTNKIISGLFLSAILAGGLFASNCDMEKRGEKSSCDRGSCSMKKGDFDKKSHRGNGHFFGMFKELNLTAEQKTKIEQIIEDSRKNIKTTDEAFTKESFDKAKYIQIMNEKRDNMIRFEAEIIEKSYAVLTTKQKEQLKVLMDLRKEKMDKKL